MPPRHCSSHPLATHISLPLSFCDHLTLLPIHPALPDASFPPRSSYPPTLIASPPLLGYEANSAKMQPSPTNCQQQRRPPPVRGLSIAPPSRGRKAHGTGAPGR